MTTEELLTIKRSEILALARKYGARNVRIFGSVARGEARPDSDIDWNPVVVFLIWVDLSMRCATCSVLKWM
jgi:predicted nucleotidyltransferase